MQDWRLQLSHDAVAALLAGEDRDIHYFVSRDLLGEPVASIATVQAGLGAQRLWHRQRENGSWPGPRQKTQVYPSNHADLIATFKQVRLLVERYEVDQSDERLRRAAEFLLGFQTREGDIRGFIGNQYATYYTGYVLSLLIKAGYTDDERVHRGMQWLLSMRQDDGGWTIPILTHSFDRDTSYRLTATYSEPVAADRTKPFSHNWTDMVLRAFAAHPRYRREAEVQWAARLLKGSFFKADAYGSYRHPRYWTRFGFWWPNLLTAMESLHLLGFAADDVDMATGVEWFRTNQTSDGLWDTNNDGSSERHTPLLLERRYWLGLRICRLLAALEHQPT